MPSYLEQLDAAPADQRWRMARGWLFGEPLPFFAELRAHRPVLALPELTLVTRYADVDLIFRDHETFGVDLYKPKQGGYWMAQDDTAQHWREKAIMSAILDREEIPAIRAWVAQKTASLLAAGHGQLDVVDGLSRAVPVALVQEWFGYKDSNAHDLMQWSYWNQIDAFWNQPFDAIVVPDPAAIVRHRELSDVALAAYIAILVAARTAEIKLGGKPQDSVSRLLELSFSGALKFSIGDVISNVGGLLIGAVETTSHCAINALEWLFAHPEPLAGARAAAQANDPTAFDGFVWEALRFKPAFSYVFRTCHRPTTLALGTPFAAEAPAGATVLAVTHSAMFDETMFAEPDRFDPTRSTASMFTFGQGLHECLGKAIGEAMTPEIVRQCLLLPDAHPVSPPDYKGGPVPEAYQLAWSA